MLNAEQCGRERRNLPAHYGRKQWGESAGPFLVRNARTGRGANGTKDVTRRSGSVPTEVRKRGATRKQTDDDHLADCLIDGNPHGQGKQLKLICFLFSFVINE